MKRELNKPLLERVLKVKRYYNISVREIAETAKMGHTTVQSQLYGIYQLDVNVVIALCLLCPEISADWLLTGRGVMMKQNSEISELEKRVAKLENSVKK